jgi:hypothetical protein
MTVELILLGAADVGICESVMIPGGPSGTRAVVEITSSECRGDRLRAKLKGVAPLHIQHSALRPAMSAMQLE